MAGTTPAMTMVIRSAAEGGDCSAGEEGAFAVDIVFFGYLGPLMTSTGPYDIKGWRLALGLVVGAAIPVALNTILSGPLWRIALAVGAGVAAPFLLLMVVPLYTALHHWRALNVYWAISLGGLLVTLPDLFITVTGLSGGLQTLSFGGKTMVADGRLTTDGVLHFLVWRPLMLFAMGAAGGIVAWLIAIGFRVRPPTRSMDTV